RERGAWCDEDLLAFEGRLDGDVLVSERREVLVHDRDSEDLRYVERRLPRKRPFELREGPVVVRVVTAHRGEHAAVAHVVRGHREIPAAESPMEIGEELDGGVRRRRLVHAQVRPAILREPVDLSGVGHELPEAERTDPRARRRIESALDHREGGEILWK